MIRYNDAVQDINREAVFSLVIISTVFAYNTYNTLILTLYSYDIVQY